MANPRIEDLRKRLDREPGSRLFAQLAEELRKDGALIEAIRVCREGLQRHPTYWTARLTLGRCLADSGDRRGGAQELELVLAAAPDNLLAGRLLGECQEALEEFAAAAATYRLLLGLAPGDKQLKERLAQLEERVAQSAARPRAASADMENRFAPIPLVEADDSFELERPLGAGGFGQERPSSAAATAADQPVAPARGEPLSASEELVFEFDGAGGTGGGTTAFEPVFRDLDTSRPGGPGTALAAAGAASAAQPVTLPGIMITELATPALASVTLAELYHEQGADERAVDIYREVLRREPENGKARQRLAELESQLGGPAPAEHSRRLVLERTIARLEALAAALQRG